MVLVAGGIYVPYIFTISAHILVIIRSELLTFTGVKLYFKKFQGMGHAEIIPSIEEVIPGGPNVVIDRGTTITKKDDGTVKSEFK